MGTPQPPPQPQPGPQTKVENTTTLCAERRVLMKVEHMTHEKCHVKSSHPPPFHYPHPFQGTRGIFIMICPSDISVHDVVGHTFQSTMRQL